MSPRQEIFIFLKHLNCNGVFNIIVDMLTSGTIEVLVICNLENLCELFSKIFVTAHRYSFISIWWKLQQFQKYANIKDEKKGHLLRFV